jgi:hypothetical protein
MNDKGDEKWNQQKIFISAFLAALTIFAELPLWEVHGITAIWATLTAFLVLLMILEVEYWYQRGKRAGRERVSK